MIDRIATSRYGTYLSLLAKNIGIVLFIVFSPLYNTIILLFFRQQQKKKQKKHSQGLEFCPTLLNSQFYHSENFVVFA